MLDVYSRFRYDIRVRSIKQKMETITPICIINIKDLKSAVNSAIKPISKKTRNQVLTYFHCSSGYYGLTLTGYDLHTGISTKIESTWWNNLDFLLPAYTLKNLIKNLSGDCHIALVKRDDEEFIQLESGKFQTEIPSLDIKHYPSIPQWDDFVATISIEIEILSRVITSCKKFTGNGDVFNAPINGINFSSQNGFFTIQSTNKHVISRYQMLKLLPTFSLTISPDSLKLPKKGKAILKFYKEYIAIETENSLAFVKTIEETFPEKVRNWQPKIKPTLCIDKKSLLSQLDIALSYSKDMIIHIYTKDNTLRLMGECNNGSFFVELPASIYQKGYLTSVNTKYFKNAINQIQSDRVTLDFTSDWYGQTEMIGIIDSTTSFFIAKIACKKIPTWLETKELAYS